MKTSKIQRLMALVLALVMLFGLAAPVYAEETPLPTAQAEAAADTVEDPAPLVETTPAPSEEPTADPVATEAPAETGEPTPAPEPTEAPAATEAPNATPEPTASAEPTAVPEATEAPTAMPEPTATPEPTASATPEPTEAPEPTATPEPTAEQRDPDEDIIPMGLAGGAVGAGDAEISSVSCVLTVDGSKPFDDDDYYAGNDNNESNHRIRTFDTLEYTFSYNTQLLNSNYDSFSSAKVYVEYTLPYSASQIQYKLDAMTWLKDAAVTTPNANTQVLTGWYTNTGNANIGIAVPGAATRNLALQVGAMRNGDKITGVTAKYWLEGGSAATAKSAVGDEVTVTATPKYNIILTNEGQGDNAAAHSRLATVNGKTCRILNFGYAIELYNDSPDKGMKGIELPTGTITTDIYFRTLRSGAEQLDRVPTVLSVQPNAANTGKVYGGTPLDSSIVIQDLPYMDLQSVSGTNLVPNSASLNISATTGGPGMTITTSGFTLDASTIYPAYAANNTTAFAENVGVITALNIEVAVPIADEPDITADYMVEAKVTRYEASSTSEGTVTQEYVSGRDPAWQPAPDTDDTTTIQYLEKVPGTRDTRYFVSTALDSTHASNAGMGSSTEAGDAQGYPGKQFYIWAGAAAREDGNDPELLPNQANIYVAIDDKAIAIDESMGAAPAGVEVSANDADGNGDITLRYIAKADGSGWNDDKEIRTAFTLAQRTGTTLDSSYVLYNSMAELNASGKKCVGFVAEIRNTLIYDYTDIAVKARIRNEGADLLSCAFNTVAMITGSVWTRNAKGMEWNGLADADLEINGGQPYKGYEKSVYDAAKHTVVYGHTLSYTGGQSILVTQYDVTVSKNCLKPVSTPTGNADFDVSAGERTADYIIKPAFAGNTVSNPTITVKDYLPEQLTYIEGSARVNATYVNGAITGGDPVDIQVSARDDAVPGQMLIWTFRYKEGTVPTLSYSCNIGYLGGGSREVYNGDIVDNTVTITGAGSDKSLSQAMGTRYTESIHITKLAEVSLAKTTATAGDMTLRSGAAATMEVDTPFYYNICGSNTGSNNQENYIMLDVLPYTADARGSSFNGSYNVGTVKIQMYGDTAASSLSLMYTTDTNVRSINSAKGVGAAAARGWTCAGTVTGGQTASIPINAAATAIALVGNSATSGLASHEYYIANIELVPTGNRGGNMYVNNVTSFGGLDTQKEDIISSNIKYMVAERSWSGCVWTETDRNGLRADSEPLLAGVTATLYNASNEVVTNLRGTACQMQTDSNGYYEFRYLPEGNFHVVFTSGSTALDNYAVVRKNAGDDTIDNDCDGSYSNDVLQSAASDNYTLPAFDVGDTTRVYTVEHVDCGLTVINRTWDGRVWTETDRNGLRADGEPLLSGVTATLYNASNEVVTNLQGQKCQMQTDANGYYLFEHLPSGSFHVVFTSGSTALDNYAVVRKNAGDESRDNDCDGSYSNDALQSAASGSRTLPAFDPDNAALVYTVENVDCGLTLVNRCYSGRVWAEDNRNGIYEAGGAEPLVQGVTVTLYNADNQVVTNLQGQKCQMQTDANGEYLFEHLPAGTFHAVVTDGKVLIAPWTVSPKDQGKDDTLDCDMTGKTSSGALVSAQSTGSRLSPLSELLTDNFVEKVEHVDCGLTVIREISGLAWLDKNNDGKRIDSEPVIPGLTVTLLGADGKAVKDIYGNTVAAVATDADGNYKFGNLAAGDYQVVIAGTDDVVLDNMQASPVQAKGVAVEINSDATGIYNGDTLLRTEIADIGLATIQQLLANASATIKVTYEDSGLFAERKLSGLVFVDFNRDGKRVDTDDILEEITVELLNKDGSAVTDVFGNSVAKQVTEIGGGYLFEHLDEGEYIVKFTGKNNRWMTWTAFKDTTLQADGVAADVNSDASATYKDGKLQYTSLSTTLPRFECRKDTAPLYTQEHLDSGLIAPVEITKSANYDDGTVITEGKTISYTIKIDCPAYEVKDYVFSDTIPEGLTWLPDTLDVRMAQVGQIKVNNINYDRSTGAVTFPALNWLKGTSTIYFTCAVDALPAGQDFLVINNQAKLTPNGGDPYESNITTHYVVSRHATIDKTAALVLLDGSCDTEQRGTANEPVATQLGQTVEYRLTVTNVANVPAGYEDMVVSGDIVVTDPIPTDTAYLDGTAKAVFASGSKATLVSVGMTDEGLQWRINGLAAGEAATLIFRVTAPATSDDPATEVYETSKIFTNTAKLLDVELSERKYEVSYTKYDKDGNVIGTYTEGDTLHKETEYKLTSPTTYHKVAEPLLTRVKTSDPESPAANGLVPVVKPGEDITYYITVENIGEAPAYNTRIKDTVPTGTTLAGIAADGVLEDADNTIYWDLGDIPAGESMTVSFTVTVNDNGNTPAIIRNVAYTANDITPPDWPKPDPNNPDPWTPTQEVDHQVYGFVKLSDPMGGSSEADAVELAAGQVITYTMQLAAEETMTDVVVTDPLPAGLVFVPGSISVIQPDGTVSPVSDEAYNADTHTVTWPSMTVTSGVTGYRVQVAVDRLADGEYYKYYANTATATGNRGNGDPWEETSEAITHKTYDGKAVIHKTAQLVDAGSGSLLAEDIGSPTAPVYTELQQAVQYSLTVTYATDKGNRSGQLIITDAIPADTTYIDGSLTTVWEDGSEAIFQSAKLTNVTALDGGSKPGIQVVLSNLADGEQVVISFRVTAPPTSDNSATPEYETSKIFTNTAKLLDVDKSQATYGADIPGHTAGEAIYTAAEYDLTSETTYHIVKEPRISISKASNPVTGTQISSDGGIITYTLTVPNDGDGDAYNVVVVDEIPQYTQFITNSARNGGAGTDVVCSLRTVNGKQAIVYVIGHIPAHSTATLEFQVRADAYGDVGIRYIDNVAQVKVTPTTPGTHAPDRDPWTVPDTPDGWTPSNPTQHTQQNAPDGGILIHKVDADTGRSLEGAAFQILDRYSKEVIAYNVTNDAGNIWFALPDGDYYYQEVTAPKGYQIDSTLRQFSINRTNIEVQVVIKNKVTPPTYGELVITRGKYTKSWPLTGDTVEGKSVNVNGELENSYIIVTDADSAPAAPSPESATIRFDGKNYKYLSTNVSLLSEPTVITDTISNLPDKSGIPNTKVITATGTEHVLNLSNVTWQEIKTETDTVPQRVQVDFGYSAEQPDATETTALTDAEGNTYTARLIDVEQAEGYSWHADEPLTGFFTEAQT